MKTTILTLSLLFAHSVSAADELKNNIINCQNISNNQARLACFDAIETTDATIAAVEENKQPTANNQFPVLLADLNEPNLMVSFGSLDFFGDDFNAVLIGAGKRHLIRDIELPNGQNYAFNVIGQIRSQFDVSELDTRNNRGGALINTDFVVGGEIVKSMPSWDWRFSYIHRSTHLGDEFIIDNPEFLQQRLNLSYEIIKWDAAKRFENWDIYAGIGFISRSEPGNLDKYTWQAGFQYQGELWHGLKPIWAVDLHSWGAYEWNINMNMRAGFEIDQFTHTPFQLMLEYYDGHSPYGQFFTEDLTYAGLTLLKNW